MSGHLTSRTTLKKVDQLRELGIGAEVSLPQMVVVGDQSSGKSSLLESLTGIPFPTNTELCTRYVTQITCRRDSESCVDVSLIPGPSATAERKAKLETFSPPPLSPEEFRTQFADILVQVNACLGLRLDVHDATTTGAVFTDDVLKIEICSPDEDYLTIIDVPGIFRTAQGATTRHDIDLVRKMVEAHIRNPRTIILAVLPANIDFATQEILALSEKYDPQGERTLGVLTKPDLILEESGKRAVCNLVLGKRKPLKLGYYLVCNRGPDGDERSVEEREMMFCEAPWEHLPKDRVGRAALKTTLSSLLAGLTKSVFGVLRQEIQKELETADKQLNGLGSPRETEQQQRIFLTSIAGKFQKLVTAARMGHYSQDDAFEEDPDLRLCTSIVNLADDLVRDFAKLGHVYKFEGEKEDSHKCNHAEIHENYEEDYEEDYEDEEVKAESPQDVTYIRRSSFQDLVLPSESRSPVSIVTKPRSTFDDDISGLLYDLPEYGPPQPGIKDWIADLHRRYRGPELTTPGPAILGSVFREQSARWDTFARCFVSSCVQVVHTFIRRALRLLCPSLDLASDLWGSISDEVLARYKRGLENAIYLARIERSLSPYTLNGLFNAEVLKSRSARLLNNVNAIPASPSEYHGRNTAVSVVALQRFAESEANNSHLNHEIHDVLNAYYKIAAKRFQDNLYMQAVNHCLVNGEETPLDVFSQEWVIGLGAGELDGLVGDSPGARALRREVEGKKGRFEKAIKILRG